MPANGQPRIRPARFLYDAGYRTSEHHHDEHQLVYASYGLLCVDTASSRWVLPPLRAAWVPAHTPHTVTAEVDSQMSTLYVDPTVDVPDLPAVTVITVSPLLRELIHHLLDSEPTGTARHHVEGLIVDQLTVAPTTPLELRQPQDPRLRAIVDVYRANPRDRRTLRELGEHVGANERTLQRLFHQETGTTFARWRTQLRLQHAIIVLGRGGTVTAAASSSGYKQPSAFIAAFRNTYGTTPSQYFRADREEDAGQRPLPVPTPGPAPARGRSTRYT